MVQNIYMDSSLNKSAEELNLLLEKISREGIGKKDIKTKLSSVLTHQVFRVFIFIFLVIMLFLTSLYIAYLKNQNEKLKNLLKKALDEVPNAQILLPSITKIPNKNNLWDSNFNDKE